MKLTILGSGGCMVIPKPCCDCRVCRQARRNGIPYERTGPSAFFHDENLLMDTPAEVGTQLNRCGIEYVDHLVFTHLDPDHTEGLRVVEQISIDFRTWEAYPEKNINLLIPEQLQNRLYGIKSAYGSFLDFFEQQGFVTTIPFLENIRIGDTELHAVEIDRGDQTVFVLVLEKNGKKIVYAPCDIKPFPEHHQEVCDPDLLVIQPGIFESGLKHGFYYPEDHISRKTLYTFEETLALARRLNANQILFVHIEEYWNRSYDDYLVLEAEHTGIQFAYDGMTINL